MCCSAVATRLAGRENDSSVVVELAIYRGLVRVGCARDILLSLALLSFSRFSAIANLLTGGHWGLGINS